MSHRRPAHPLRGGIRRDQVRVLFLQGLETAIERVVFPVGNLRPGFDIVEMIVPLYLGAKL